MYVPLRRFLLRAPLLPVAALGRGVRGLLADPLGRDAVALASPGLAKAKATTAARRAIGRYARRAAFRPTPHGLLAGVCVGSLGQETAIATGRPRPHRAPRWASVEALARSLLDDEAIRERVHLRLAPSALVGASVVRWVGPGSPIVDAQEADIDEILAAVLETSVWTPWPALRARIAERDPGADSDGFLLDLLDSGLLESDLSPPLVGPPPATYLADKLAELAIGGLAQEAVASLPEDHAVLVHRPHREPTLDRVAVGRAARLVPLLVRLQEALAPPAAERFQQPMLADALDAVTEIHGAGAFDLAALGAGDYGVEIAGPPVEPEGATPPGVLGLLVQAIVEAIRTGREEASLDRDALERALSAAPSLSTALLPSTAELFLIPRPSGRGRRPGAGWLLGLHAPAGASLGRFAHALGDPLLEALADLAVAERRIRPREERVDLAFAPSPALADLCSHPQVRERVLALGHGTGGEQDLLPRGLEVVADPAGPDALALRDRDRATAIVPSPLFRVRSATAPPGVSRLLVGWSLQRQHAPWALPLRPLAELPYLPRISLDDFVIAPRTWRLPSDRSPRALAAWRRRMGVPRHVQVGEGDELLPVDLQARDLEPDLADVAHVYEIWPPLDELVDRNGRRTEAVVMVVDEPDEPPTRAQPGPATAILRAARVPPPHEALPLPGWRTFKVFGAERHQDDLLCAEILPAVEGALAAGDIDRWFFLRYVDGPGRRHHLRLRVHGAPDTELFARRLEAALAEARARGAVVMVETADYILERGRYRPEEIDAVHEIFQLDSERITRHLEREETTDDLARLVFFAGACDALAAGLGLPREAREGLARTRRRAEETWVRDEERRLDADVAFRAAAPALRTALGQPPDAEIAAFAEAARGLTLGDGARLLPVLLHLSAVRLFGPDRDAERLGYIFWERTLEGLRKREAREGRARNP